MEDTILCFVTVPCGVRLSMQTVCAAVDLRNVIIRHSSPQPARRHRPEGGYQRLAGGRQAGGSARHALADHSPPPSPGGDLSVLGLREARALISDARRIPMIYYLYSISHVV